MLFEVTYGRNKEIKGLVEAKSHEQLQTELRRIGWPIMSSVVQMPVIQLSELETHLARLKS